MRGHDFHLVNDECLIGHDRFVPRRQKCAGQEAEDFVGAIAKNDLLRRHLPTVGNRLPQPEGPAVRIPVQRCDPFIDHSHGFWRRTQWVFI